MTRARSVAIALFVVACRAAPPPAVAVPPAVERATAPAPAPRPAPAVGAACVPDPKVAEVCVSDTSALACHDGRWVALACGGPAGCGRRRDEDQCDQSIAEAGSECNLAGDVGCDRARASMLTCARNKWRPVQPCRGARGCAAEDKKVTCDNTVAREHDACVDEDDFACTADGTAALVCHGRSFALASPCKGPGGCTVTGTRAEGFRVACDDSIGSVGDPCVKEHHYSCAEDGTAILRCDGQALLLEDRCKKKERCAIRQGQVGCY